MEVSDVLLLSLDSCRYDTFALAHSRGSIPNLASIAPLHKAMAPSYFTYGSHAAIWMGFTPGISDSCEPWLNPKAGKLFRMAYAGSSGQDDDGFQLQGANIIQGFRKLGYKTIGSGAVDWFDPSTQTGEVLGAPFENFHFAGNTWSLGNQLNWIEDQLKQTPNDQPVFVFLNIGETHVPYWHEGASWDCWPSPCVPFGGKECSAEASRVRQQACLEWVDKQLASLLERFSNSTILAFADHGDCWGEDGLWEHGVSHKETLTVPLLIRVRGIPVSSSKEFLTNSNQSRNAFLRISQWVKARF